MRKRHVLALLILMGGITALSIDIYLPAVSEIAEGLGTDANHVSWTISIFMVSFACGQLFYGHLSDRWGRKVTFLSGMAIYLLANVGCAWSTNIESLLVWRFFQGLGACAGTVSCFAIARDLFSGQRLTEILSTIATAIALAPILAPIIGAKLTLWWNWQASFLFLAAISVVLMLWSGLGLPETRPEKRAALGSIRQTYWRLLKHPVFMRFSVINSFSFGGLFVFISGGAPLLVGEWGLSPDQFGYLFAANASMYMAGSFCASRIAKRISIQRMSQWGAGLSLTGGLLILGLSGLHSIAALLLPMFLVSFGVALTLPSSASGALEPLGDQAGSAAALQGFMRFGCAGIVGAVHSMLPLTSALPLGIFITACALVTLAFSLWVPGMSFRSVLNRKGKTISISYQDGR